MAIWWSLYLNRIVFLCARIRKHTIEYVVFWGFHLPFNHYIRKTLIELEGLWSEWFEFALTDATFICDRLEALGGEAPDIERSYALLITLFIKTTIDCWVAIADARRLPRHHTMNPTTYRVIITNTSSLDNRVFVEKTGADDLLLGLPTSCE